MITVDQLPHDANFQRKLSVAEDLIKKSKEEGSKQFLEVKRYPLVSLTLRAGTWNENKTIIKVFTCYELPLDVQTP